MANHASAKKRIRQTIRRTARNRHIKVTVRTLVKRVRTAVEQRDTASAKAAFQEAARRIDMAVSKGVFHRRTGSRHISRLAAQVNAISSVM